jgi:hypothetical protein
VVCLILIILYLFGRMYASCIAGGNCLKRILIAIVLSLAHYSGINKLLIVIEVCYAVMRIFVEKPYTNMLFMRLYIEELLIIIVYIVLIFDTSAVTTIVFLTVIAVV